MRRALALALLVAACGSGRRDPGGSDPADAPPDQADYSFPDAAPPPFDAAPLAEMSCHGPSNDAGTQCELPPSQCLDANYLIYYTDPACVNHVCEFQTHWLYCYSGCIDFVDPAAGDACGGGFT